MHGLVFIICSIRSSGKSNMHGRVESALIICSMRSAGKSDMHGRVESALQDVSEKFLMLEGSEKAAVRTALVEERSRYCLFISCLKPVIVSLL